MKTTYRLFPFQGFFSLSATARRLRTSRRGVIKEIKSGELVARQFGKQLRVHSEDLNKFEARRSA